MLPVPLLGPDGAPEHALLIVDLDSAALLPAEDLAAASAACRSFESVVRVGVSREVGPVEHSTEPLAELLDALDLNLAPEGSALAQARQVVPTRNPDAALEEVAAVVRANPLAATVLAQVLRAAERASVIEAVNIESFAFSALLRSREFAHWLGEVREPGMRQPDPVPEPVLIERITGEAGADGVGMDELHVTLNRPERRNAYGRQLRDALADALRAALLDPSITRVRLDGAGRMFSSGGELSEFGLSPDTGLAHFIRTRAGAGHLIHRLGDRITVEVHGACIGAGIEIAAFAGRVVARGSTVFRLPEVTMGLIPGAGGTASISRRIGRHRTAWLALSARTIGAERALDWGLIDAALPRQD